jgi:phage anti-repressor protein
MPYIVEDQDEKDKSQLQLQQTQGNIPQANTEGGIISGETDLQKGGNSKIPSKSGSFTNLEQYLSANQDQTADLTNKIADPIQQKADQSRTGAQQASTQFKGLVDQGTNQYDSNLVSSLDPGKTLNLAERSRIPQTSLNASPSNDVQYGVAQKKATDLNDDEKQKINQMRTATYQGPNSIEDTELLQPSRNLGLEANRLGQMGGTEAGRFSLLDQTVGNPNYKQGEKRLDQSLLQKSDIAKQRFEDLQKQTMDLPTYLSQVAQQSNALVDPARKLSDETRLKTQQGLQKASDDYLTGVDARVEDLLKQKTDQYNNAKGQLQSRNVDADLAKEIGLMSPNIAGGRIKSTASLADRNNSNLYSQDLFRLNPLNYLSSFDASQINRNTGASKEQQAQIQALSELANISNALPDKSQAQTADAIPGAKFDQSHFKSDVSTEQHAFDDYFNNRMKELGMIDSRGHQLVSTDDYNRARNQVVTEQNKLFGQNVNAAKTKDGLTNYYTDNSLRYLYPGLQ